MKPCPSANVNMIAQEAWTWCGLSILVSTTRFLSSISQFCFLYMYTSKKLEQHFLVRNDESNVYEKFCVYKRFFDRVASNPESPSCSFRAGSASVRCVLDSPKVVHTIQSFHDCQVNYHARLTFNGFVKSYCWMGKFV